MKEEIRLEGVTEYAEERPVVLMRTTGLYRSGVKDQDREGYGRLVVRAWNEGGYNCTEVDLLQLIDWLKKNKPELLK